MKKKLILFLSLLLTASLLGGCGKKNEEESTLPDGDLQTDFRYEECGLAYKIPENWLEQDNINLIPVSFVDPEGSIYAKIEYDYSSDNNIEDLNDPESVVPVEELMTPLLELLVVREENLESDEVKAEFELYSNIQELPAQDGFLFYFLSDYTAGIDHLDQAAQKSYESLEADFEIFLESVETFPPDESKVTERVALDKEYLNFMSTTLDGEDITSTAFYDYDMTVINFWASYCYADGINELETLQSFYKDLQKKHPNVNFLQVVIDTPEPEAEKIVKKAYEEAGVTFTGVMPDQNMAAWIIDNLNGLPTTIFVDSTGKPASLKVEGMQDAAYYMETTENMLQTMPKREQP